MPCSSKTSRCLFYSDEDATLDEAIAEANKLLDKQPAELESVWKEDVERG